MSETSTETGQQQPIAGLQSNGDIVARAGRYYRFARYIIFLMFMAWGLWCVRDGFFEYPKANEKAINDALQKAETELGHSLSEGRRIEIIGATKLPHGGYDIPLNRGLAVILPPLSVLVIIWTLYRSRGEYRLSGATLHVPGHPPIPLDCIRRIDKTRWDRKGIAVIAYELPGGESEEVKIDDFVYEQDPTDAIMDQIDKYITAKIAPAPQAQSTRAACHRA